MVDERLYELFKEKAELVNSEVYRFKTKKEALDFITCFFTQYGISVEEGKFAVWADNSFLSEEEKQRLSSSYKALGFEITKIKVANSKIGISTVDWALAETGTLVQDASKIEQRLVSMLPEVHIAIASSKKIFLNLSTLLPFIKPENASFFAMITGPSRTADIERVLTIGVHGPERLIIVFVDEI
ncbi:MAG: lactate utilization protein [Thermodesulfovibrionales bacterium]|nr:lactate utilization protein [Thermodesulfovibrionales bacterium]